MNTCQKQDNCLNLFKLVAALQVMCGHIIAHLEVGNIADFDKMFGVFKGVPIFFTLSGFLIWFSIKRSESYTKYIRKRFWRIYPEMWLAIAVEIVVMCILYRGWNVRDTALYTLTQSTFLQFWTPDSLSGYGYGSPNAALWSICTLIQFYIIAWFLYKLLKNRKWFVWIMTVVASIVISELGRVVIESMNNEILEKLYRQTVIRYLWLFLLGMGLACFCDKVILFCKKWWPVFICMGFIVSFNNFDISAGYDVLKTLFVILAIIGFSYRFPRLKLKYDISYGVYIYHMTVINIMITFGWMGKYIHLLIAAVISCILGYVSTITIGKYCAKKG